MAERKYRMNRVAAGDYILPGNDAQTIWRIRKYIEGPSSGVMEWPRDKEVWGLWKWLGRFDRERGALDPFDLDDPSQWEFMEGPHFSRAESIGRAVELAPGPSDEIEGRS